MREGFFATLIVLLVSQGFALSQDSPGLTSPLPPPEPWINEPSGVQAHPNAFWYWVSGEYLLWWFKNGRVPPLVTAGGNGVPGTPGTQILLDNLDFDDDFRHGGRFSLGYRFAANPCWSAQVNYLFVADRPSNVRFASNGNPILGRPYINVVTGMPTATLIASPGIAAGTVGVEARTRLWGADANLAAVLACSDRFHLAALGGFRFCRLEDQLEVGEQFQVSPSVPGFGGSNVGLVDKFRTDNRFYGGQVGLAAGLQLGLVTIDFSGKIALGLMEQAADVEGSTAVLASDGTMTRFEGGLLALRTNIGRHQRDKLAFLPEVRLNVGLQLTSHLKLYAGYSFLWISSVARAGEQIDPVINETQFPILSGNGPLAGPARPAFPSVGTDFWAQGLNVGFELRY